FFSSFRPTPRRLAAAYRYIHPDSTLYEFKQFMSGKLPGSQKPPRLRMLYDRYATDRFSLADQGYMVTVHPLELWLVRYLITHPGAKYGDVIEDSGNERVEVYRWLFHTANKNAQDFR